MNGPNGTVYSRGGSFHINNEGILTTPEGYPLRAAGGGVITVDPNNATEITIDPDGNVSQGGAPLGQLEVVSFDPDDLKNLKRINVDITERALQPRFRLTRRRPAYPRIFGGLEYHPDSRNGRTHEYAQTL